MNRLDLISKIRENLKGILIFCSVFTALILFFVAWTQRERSLEKKAQASLYELKKSLDLLGGKEEKKSEKPLAPDSKGEKPSPLKGDIQQKRNLIQYEEAIRKNQKRRISTAFAIDLADFYNREGESSKAISLLSLFAFPKRASSLYQLASFQLASYYMNARDCEKALPLLSSLILNKKALPFHLESRLQEALCLEFMNRGAEALVRYEELAQEDPEGYTGRKAQDYKNLLLLSRRLKEAK